MGNSAKKIISIERYIVNRELEKEDYQDFMDLYVQLNEKAERRALDKADGIVKNKIAELENRCMKQEIKLQNCIPSGILCRIVLYASLVVAFLSIFVTQIIGNYKILDYHILLVLVVACSGLLHTAVSTLRDWKDFITSVEE